MQKVQKTYTSEFKREAVRLAQASGKPIAQVTCELGISDICARSWWNTGLKPSQEVDIKRAQEEEIRRLKREWDRVQKERDILKKPHIESLPMMRNTKVD